MELKEKLSEQKNCRESCGCTSSDKMSEQQKSIVKEVKIEEKKLDPTYFGDWQVNCRAIDF